MAPMAAGRWWGCACRSGRWRAGADDGKTCRISAQRRGENLARQSQDVARQRIAEAERGEDVAKAAYENALRETLDAGTRTIVQQQSTKVRQAHDAARDLRDRQKVAH